MRNRVRLSAILALAFSIGLAACGGRGAIVTSGPPTVTTTPTLNSPIATALPAVASPIPTPIDSIPFEGAKAFEWVTDQMHFGPRPTGSREGRATGDYIVRRLKEFGWEVTEQEFEYLGATVRNIIGARGAGSTLILGAHYDTRKRADLDTIDPTQPMPGANDGASGVAVLIELARVLNVEATGHRIQLAFFDAEDNGGLDGWEWIVGSTHMAAQLEENPEMMVLVDMIGDADQQIYWEGNSDTDLRERIWGLAAELGYEAYFVPETRHTITDDHTPFLRLGIPAVDIIDFDYAYWHTAADTLDKVSADSLERVGRTLQVWLERGAP
ncbi:MAG: M28 family peptidase [Anaerolineae bacterium]